MKITKEITLDVSRLNRFQSIIAKQNDKDSRYLKVSVSDEGNVLIIPSSAKATITATRPDKLSSSFLGKISEDGKAIVPLSPWMLELDGSLSCEVSIITEESVLKTTSFYVDVEPDESSGNTDVIQDPNYDILVELIQEVSGVAAIEKEAISTAVDAYLHEKNIRPLQKGVDYWTDADKAEINADNIAFITTELAKRGQLKPEFANSVDEMTDTSKIYVMPDGYMWAYMLTEVEAGPSYTNVLPLAINADGTPYVGNNGEKGYKTGWRLNSTAVEKEGDGNCMTGYIPVKNGDTIRVKGVTLTASGGGYFHWYASDFSLCGSAYYENYTNDNYNTKPDANGVIMFNAPIVNANGSYTNLTYFRMTTGVINDATVITINEEIAEGGSTITEYAWANTGIAFVSTDYGPRVMALEKQTAQNTADIAALKKGAADTGGVDALTWIRNWDAPIYDANIPVFQLSAEKAAMTNATMTPDALYTMYDALMAKYPHYITKTDLGICSDGVNHVYRYDFKDPEQRHTNNRNSETKAKAIIVSGIHLEWAGMFGLYYALEEITENPILRDLRRNVHLIVIPCSNPYTTLVEHYEAHGGQQNANGVEVHRNFEAGFLYPDDAGYVPFGELHHGGTEPLSEVETQYIDNVLKANTDAAFFMTCHNFNLDEYYGVSFLWPSVATAYMCNMGYRLIDRMSQAWTDKYGDELAPGIASYRTDLLESWDTRLGYAQISGSPGTETRQATKYGIQGANVEICERFHVHGTRENPEPKMSSFTMSRGCEALVNFILMCFGAYDYKDKKEYAAPETT